MSQTYIVDPHQSSLEWNAYKLASQHNGTVAIASGRVEAEGNQIQGGFFEVNMDSIIIADIKDKVRNQKLVTHLKNEDFFKVDKFSTVKFEITNVEGEGSTTEVMGNLSIKGITKSISFQADVTVENDTLTAMADFEIDRTNWDVKFRSGKFFQDLGDKLIKDQIGFSVKIVANK